MKQEPTERTAAFKATCKPIEGSPIVVVPCKASMLTVTYTIDIVSAATLAIPYAVAINGKVLPIYAERSRTATAIAANPKTKKKAKPAEITIPAQAGDTVALHLNSDAAPAWRTKLLYSVTLNEHPVAVHVTERMGLHHDRDTPVFKGHNVATGMDEYTAALTGNIWMDASHVYQSSEVDERLPQGTRPEVVRAIKSIYDGLPTRWLNIEGPARGTEPAYTLAVEFEDSDNPRKNVVHYQLLADGLTRVHPGGYAALFNAAIGSGIDKIVVTSCWRPLLGSIAHRLGLGLDVNFVGGVRLNRQELTTGQAAYRDADANVSEGEVALFRQMKAAETAHEQAKRNAKRILDEDGQKAANAQLKEAMKAEREAKLAWNFERDKHEPPKVRSFRALLLNCACVRQLFDPWYMFANARAQGLPNRQETDNENTHSHHLHITVSDRAVFLP
jgi:hypothetical protein